MDLPAGAGDWRRQKQTLGRRKHALSVPERVGTEPARPNDMGRGDEL
jgi:hypothetical protein